MQTIDSLIEAFLFWKNEPVSIKKLAETFALPIDNIRSELAILKQKLEGRGIVLMEKEEEVFLGTSVEASSLIEKMTKEELSKELSKAALETLSIVIYKGPVKRSEIDYIRGVNSQFILRHLEIRGLVEKAQSEEDGRAFLYKPTFELLSFLGVSKIEELPEFDVLRKVIEEFNSNEEAFPKSEQQDKVEVEDFSEKEHEQNQTNNSEVDRSSIA